MRIDANLFADENTPCYTIAGAMWTALDLFEAIEEESDWQQTSSDAELLESSRDYCEVLQERIDCRGRVPVRLLAHEFTSVSSDVTKRALGRVGGQKKLTPYRKTVLGSVTNSGATRKSPLRLHGPAFKAGIWLYENDLLGMTSEGFYPLEIKS